MKLAALFEAPQLYKRELLHLQQELAPFDTQLGHLSFSTDDNPLLVLITSVDNKGFLGAIEATIESGEHQASPVLTLNSDNLRRAGNDFGPFKLESTTSILIASDAIKTALIKGAVQHLCSQAKVPDLEAHILVQESVMNDYLEAIETALADGKLDVAAVYKHKLDEAHRRYKANGTKVLISNVNTTNNKAYLVVRLP